jgi:hypothetical protein
MHANLPTHIYVNVDNKALGPNMPDGVTGGIWHAVYSRPGQVLMAHVLLESGANWSGLPLQSISTQKDFSIHHTILQPWGAMGDQLEVFPVDYLEGLECKLLKWDGKGRHTGIMIDWTDGFSKYPQEHKPLNLIELSSGQFSLLPNNYLVYDDAHFVNLAAQQNLKHYRRGEEIYWEGDKTK